MRFLPVLWAEENPAPARLLSPVDGSLPFTVTLDVSALGGTDATILFRLIGGGHNTTDTVTIANLSVGPEVGSGPLLVPEPSGIVLAWIGVLCFTFCYFKRGRLFPNWISPRPA